MHAEREKKFKALFDDHVDLVRYVLLRYGVASSEVEDYVQETFLKLWRFMEQIDDEAAVKGWLVTTAKRLVIDASRKKREVLGEVHETSVEVDDALEREVESRVIGELLDELGREEDFATLVQHYRMGHSMAQIAQHNGESVSAVTTRMTRLRRRLHDVVARRIDEAKEQLRRAGVIG